jgi:hypothetical protein
MCHSRPTRKKAGLVFFIKDVKLFKNYKKKSMIINRQNSRY